MALAPRWQAWLIAAMKNYIVTGTDTDAGKTVAAAALLLQMRARYWKPLQSGTDADTGLTDRQRVQQLTALPDENFLPEVFRFAQPLSPHRASELDNIEIQPEKIIDTYKNIIPPLPPFPSPLLIEGAGGLMVPITRDLLQIDLFAQMQTITATPMILVARTTLGTINHSLLSLAAIQSRKLPLAGMIFTGPDNPDNIQTILDFAARAGITIPHWAHLPRLEKLDKFSLAAAARDHLTDFIYKIQGGHALEIGH